MYSRIVLMGLLCILDRGIQICCDLLSTLLDVADPISLDVLVKKRDFLVIFGDIELAKKINRVGGFQNRVSVWQT